MSKFFKSVKAPLIATLKNTGQATAIAIVGEATFQLAKKVKDSARTYYEKAKQDLTSPHDDASQPKMHQ